MPAEFTRHGCIWPLVEYVGGEDRNSHPDACPDVGKVAAKFEPVEKLPVTGMATPPAAPCTVRAFGELVPTWEVCA